MFVEKVEAGSPGDFRDLSDEELEKRWLEAKAKAEAFQKRKPQKKA
jgi:hypothetical protein